MPIDDIDAGYRKSIKKNTRAGNTPLPNQPNTTHFGIPERDPYTGKMAKERPDSKTRVGTDFVNRNTAGGGGAGGSSSSSSSSSSDGRSLPGPRAVRIREPQKLDSEEVPFYCSLQHTKSMHERHERGVPASGMYLYDISSRSSTAVRRDGRPSPNWSYFVKSCTILSIGLLVCLLYAQTKLAQLAEKRKGLSEQELQAKLELFPRHPLEYNMRQRLWHQVSYGRRHNFMAIGIFSLSIVILTFAMIVHRYRRVAIQKRKTVAFWIWTFLAMFVSVCYPVYIMKTRQPVRVVYHEFKTSPHLRFSLILTTIIVAGMLLYSYFRYVRRQHRRRHHHHAHVTKVGEDGQHQQAPPVLRAGQQSSMAGSRKASAAGQGQRQAGGILPSRKVYEPPPNLKGPL